MLELIHITNDPDIASRCDQLARFRIFVDLERLGKAQRQAGRNTFISAHVAEDVGRVKKALRHSRLMVRVNPLHAGTAAEVHTVLEQGADLVMLPMFTRSAQLRELSAIVAGRVPIVALLETGAALECLDEWITTPGLAEVYVGLNDLHLSLGQRFMFEPLALGVVDRVATAAGRHGLPFGFGGIARMDEGLLPGRDVLAEHLRLGSGCVILSRGFHAAADFHQFEREVARLRQVEQELAARSAEQIGRDKLRIAQRITQLAAANGVRQ